MKKLIYLLLSLSILLLINCSSSTDSDSNPPTVNITKPQDGEIITDSIITIEVEATDDKSILSITIYVDSIEIGSSTDKANYEHEWYVFYWSYNNEHTIHATALDDNDNTGSESINVTVTEEAYVYPKLIEPADSSDVTNPVEFKWTSLPQADSYDLIVVHDTLTFPYTIYDTTFSETYFLTGPFYWKVRAERIFISGADTSKYSPIYHFNLNN